MKIVSLQDRRNRRQQLVSRQSHDTETRIRDLEEDLLRAIDLVLDMERRLETQGGILRRLLRLLKKKLT